MGKQWFRKILRWIHVISTASSFQWFHFVTGALRGVWRNCVTSSGPYFLRCIIGCSSAWQLTCSNLNRSSGSWTRQANSKVQILVTHSCISKSCDVIGVFRYSLARRIQSRCYYFHLPSWTSTAQYKNHTRDIDIVHVIRLVVALLQ